MNLGNFFKALRGSGEMETKTNDVFPVQKSDAEWKQELDAASYEVLRHHGTERAGTSPLNHEKREGMFRCAGCGQELFVSGTKYESGSGWPSFYKPLDGAVEESTDSKFGMVRTEVHCSK